MPTKFKCMECDNPPYEDEISLGAHLMWEHGYAEKIKINGELKYTCVICNEIFDKEDDLAKDLMWSHGLATEIPEDRQ